jgi:spermidine synthase
MKPQMALISTFVTGFLTLSIEMVGGRVLAPYFGSSLYQWAGLIGVALIAYALGYSAWKSITRLGVGSPLILGGLYVLSLPLWVLKLLDPLLNLPIAWASVLAASVIVGVPSFLWSGVLPWALKASDERSGAILASSTLGSLLGAWGISFLMIPELGTRASLVVVALVSLLLGLFIFLQTRAGRTRVLGVLAFLVCLPASAWMVKDTRQIWSEPWRIAEAQTGEDTRKGLERSRITVRDSGYQMISIWDESYLGKSFRVLMLGGSVQFYWNQEEKLHRMGERFEYYNHASASNLLTADGASKRALILGLGGGLIPYQIQEFFPSTKLHAFELDPEVERVAREFLPLSKTTGIGVTIGDGRQLLREDRGGWDYILLDTFLNSYVPFHLTTREFFKLTYDRLAPGGVLVANFHSIFETTGLLEKLEASLASVYDEAFSYSLKNGTTFILAIRRAPGEPIGETLRQRLSKPCEAGEICEYYYKLQNALARGQLRSLGELARREDLYLTDDRNDTERRLFETRREVLVQKPF